MMCFLEVKRFGQFCHDLSLLVTRDLRGAGRDEESRGGSAWSWNLGKDKGTEL